MLQLNRLQSPTTPQGAEQRLVPLVKGGGMCAEETKVQMLKVASGCQSIADEGSVGD